MSPSDILNISEELVYIVGTVILGLGAIRGLEIGRAFVGGIYRSRAFWLIALVVLFAFDNISSYIPAFNGNGLNLGQAIFELSFFVVYVFVDRNLLITMQIDFFHRNTLRWTQFRWLGYIVLIVTSLALAGIAAFTNTSTLSSASNVFIVIIVSYFASLALILGYSSVALVMGAKRTPDRTFRNFVRLLGITLALAVISATIWLIPFVGNFVSAVFALAASYGIYLCVMSLSPISKVEKIEA